MLGETSDGELKLFASGNWITMLWKANLTLQMKIHLHNSALANEFWSSEKLTYTMNQCDAKKCRALEVAKCCRRLLQTC